MKASQMTPLPERLEELLECIKGLEWDLPITAQDDLARAIFRLKEERMACDQCHVKCEYRDDPYNTRCEPGIDCLAAK